MISSTVILRSGCLAVGHALLDQALRLPKSMIEVGLDRASTWANWAASITYANAPTLMRGVQIAHVDFEAEQESLTRALSDAAPGHQILNQTLNWKVDGELVGVPPHFEQLVAGAKFVHFRVETCFGGCVNVANRLLAIAGDKATSHVTTLAASASAILAALCPGKRTMNREAQLLMHTSRAVCFGDAKQLRKRADEIERLEDETAARLARRSGQSVRWCRSLSDGRDFIFTAAEAKRRGLVDEVVE